MKFAEDFVFGGATAAYQCEGSTREYGKGNKRKRAKPFGFHPFGRRLRQKGSLWRGY